MLFVIIRTPAKMREAQIDIHVTLTYSLQTGYTGGDGASNYGEGHSLLTRYDALNRIKHDFLG